MSENEGHGSEKKNPGQCELGQEGCHAAELLAGCRNLCLPIAQSRSPSGKKKRGYCIQGFQNTVLCVGNCGNDVLKNWDIRIRKDAVTWQGV